MIKNNLKKIISVGLLVATFMAVNPMCANAEWRNSGEEWWYAEGDSYIKNCWKEIDGKWYYFDYDGYILRNTIIDGYYLNSDGIWINNPSEEIKMYQKLLKDKNWIKKNTNKTYDIYLPIILDIDQDGISEMLFHSDCNGGLAGGTFFVVTYNKGNINVESLANSHGGYYGYSNIEKTFIIAGNNRGSRYFKGYKLVNNKCEQVFSLWDSEGMLRNEYYIDNKKVSREEYYKFFEKFGKIDKSQNQIRDLVDYC